MKKPTLPYEVIYLLSFATHTKEEGVAMTYLALDGYSKHTFPYVVLPEFKNDQQVMEGMEKFMNGISEEYDQTKHAQSTIYITDIDQATSPFIKAQISPDDTLVYDPAATREAFKSIIKGLGLAI